METLLRDVRFAVRAMRRSISFTGIAVLCLALGIGAVSTIFGIVDTLFFRPPAGVGDPGRIVQPYITRRTGAIGQEAQNATSYPEYLDLRDHARSLSGLAAFRGGYVFSIGRGAAVERAEGMFVSQNYFPVLEVAPALGRFFVAEEDAGPGSPPAVVVSHAYWQSHFGGDPGVVGKTIVINGHPCPIVGVAPAGFHGIDPGAPDLWVPFSQKPRLTATDADFFTNRISTGIQLAGRLAPGVTREQAQAELQALLVNVARSQPQLDPHPELVLGPVWSARGPSPSEQATIARWLALAAVLVLAIACANTANLLLARAAARRKEVAIRLSVGASRGRIVRQLLTESILLGLLGAAAGLLLALWGAGLVPTVGLPALDFFAQGRVLVFAMAAAVLCGLLFGLAPALATTRTELAAVMKEGTRAGVDRRSRLRSTLTIAQVALAVVLLAGAGLFVHSLRNVRAIDAGFDVDHLLHASLDLESMGYGDSAMASFYDRALERLRAVPGVAGATLVQTLPLSGAWSMMSYRIPGHDARTAGGADASGAALMSGESPLTYSVGPHYFTTIGTPIRRGRDFTERDRAGSTQVAIINEAFAKREWPAANPIGQCIDVGPPSRPDCYIVVGIVANAKYATLTEQARPAFFLPLAQQPGRYRSLLIRTAGAPSAMLPSVRHALQALADDLPYANIRTMEDVLRPQLQPRRLGAAMFSVFGLVALALAAIGLYGVVAYAVQQRTHELGIRMALGARARHVSMLVLRQGAALTLVGLAIGVTGALAAARLVTHLLFGVHATDPVTFAGVCVLLGAVAALASWVPARRATRVDPMVALRSE